jgi:hypothetical protein
MNDDIQKRLRDAFAEQENAPPFDATWQGAERQFARRRRRLRTFTGVAAAALAIAVVFYARTPAPVDEPLIEMGELLGTTYWQAPSDALLPEHRIDLYEDLPALIGSPDPGEGALL